jgi:hypothetical protein
MAVAVMAEMTEGKRADISSAGKYINVLHLVTL